MLCKIKTCNATTIKISIKINLWHLNNIVRLGRHEHINTKNGPKGGKNMNKYTGISNRTWEWFYETKAMILNPFQRPKDAKMYLNPQDIRPQ